MICIITSAAQQIRAGFSAKRTADKPFERLCCVGTAVVIHLFQLPNHFVFGGVTGMAVLLSTATGISFSTLNIAINLLLLVAAFLCLGRSFGSPKGYNYYLRIGIRQ